MTRDIGEADQLRIAPGSAADHAAYGKRCATMRALSLVEKMEGRSLMKKKIYQVVTHVFCELQSTAIRT